MTSKRASRHNSVHFFDIPASKSAPTPTCLAFFTSKCAPGYNGVHSFHIATSKSAPELRCFVHVHFHMCFVPQRRTLFPHLNFQKCSGAEVFCTFPFHMFFAPQRCAIVHLSSGQLAPHPPLWRAFFSTCRSHKTEEKHNVSRPSYLFAHLHRFPL